MSIKAYAYSRFSSDGQSDGDSIERQLATAEAYAAAHGLEIDTSYRDEGVSSFRGANRKDGALARFLRNVVTGVIPSDSYLIIEDFDRLSREPVTTALATFTALINAGITVVTTMDGSIYSRSTIDREWSKLIVGLARMAAAHVESEKKSERALRNWKVRRESGRVVDALTKPAWIDVVDGEFKVNDDKAPIMLRIFEEIAAGVGVNRVAQRLNEDGVEAWGVAYRENGKRAGQTRKWHGSYIQVILNGRAAIGEHQHHQYEAGSKKRIPIGEPIPGYFPPVVSLDLYHRAKTAFKARNVGGGRKSVSLVNLFGEAIKCADCGSRMRWGGHHDRARDGGNFAYYRCSSVVQRTGCDHPSKHRVIYLENAVLDLVTEIRLEGLADDAEAKAMVAEAQHQLQIAKDRASKIADLLIDLDTPVMRAKFSDAQAAIPVAEAAVQDAQSELALVRTRLAPSNQQTAIAELRAAYSKTRDIELRLKLAGAVKIVMDSIVIDRDGFASVSVMGGARVYRFEIAKRVTTFTLVSGQTVMEIGYTARGGENAYRASIAA
ncbi:recombinase family protein [Brevundimonas naejangsanensis]|uniref:recombinase family protein n=1 Tax=Brevundimonas naejangsanensis TaxID=588932 RepID=UPI0026E9D002|nr:recombinase family protein [Brevundimonas naejangsanensis]